MTDFNSPQPLPLWMAYFVQREGNRITYARHHRVHARDAKHARAVATEYAPQSYTLSGVAECGKYDRAGIIGPRT